MFFAKPLQRSNLCASHRQRRWLTHGELMSIIDKLKEGGVEEVLLVAVLPRDQ